MCLPIENPTAYRRNDEAALTRPYDMSRRWTVPIPEHAAVIEKFRSGHTAVAIAEERGISPACVRTVLRAYKVSRCEGGDAVARRREKAARRAAKALGKIEKWYLRVGVPAERFASHEAAQLAYQRFKEQRMRARARSIGWEFTFAAWWQVWCESGKWGRRGNANEQYVMARFGDVGPYSTGNVKIITFNENISEYWRDVFPRREAVGGSEHAFQFAQMVPASTGN